MKWCHFLCFTHPFMLFRIWMSHVWIIRHGTNHSVPLFNLLSNFRKLRDYSCQNRFRSHLRRTAFLELVAEYFPAFLACSYCRPSLSYLAEIELMSRRQVELKKKAENSWLLDFSKLTWSSEASIILWDFLVSGSFYTSSLLEVLTFSHVDNS